MFATHKKIEGFFIILIILVSFYIGIVQIVNALEPDGILKSLTAKSLRNTNSASQFVVGDVLTVEAEADLASRYDLQIYQNSSLVFERNGQVSDSLVKVRIPLDPPIFNSGSECFAFLYVFISNYPIPGVYFIDHVSWVFKITGTETSLSLNGEYDNVMRNLCLCANLTDINGYPVVNETIHFFLQSVSRRRPTNGWLPIGCAVTNASGLYASRLAVGVRSGDYLIKACHKRNENFGESESVIGINVSSEIGLESPVLYARSDTFVDSGRVFGSNGTVSIEPSSHSPYAVLPMNATGRYISNTPLGPGIKAMIFYADYTNYPGCIAWGSLSLVDESPSYVYECPLLCWTPNITGFHRLIGGVAVGNISDILRAVRNGTGIIASGSVDLDIQRCPSNMVLHFPEAVYDDVLPVTAAFSEPRLYEANDDGWFAACSLGPELEYNNGSYVIDEPVELIPIKLYVNNTFMGIAFTKEDGFTSVPLQLNFTGIRSELSIKAVVDEPSLIYNGGTVIRNVTFSRVNVHGVVSGGSSSFELNYTVGGHGHGEEEIYVGAQNSVEVEAELFELPICNAPVSVLIGKPVKRDCTNSSGWVSIPAGSSFLRTARLYNITYTTAYNASCDIVPDGKVDIKDLTALIKAYGSTPGKPKWNWRADVNFDLKVDIKDEVLVIKNNGKVIRYIDNIVDDSIIKVVFFKGGQQYQQWLDFWGCFSVPSGVERIGFYRGGSPIGAVVEFFRDASHQEGNTNNLGMAETTWVPSETGSATSSYFLLVRLPSNFTVLTAQLTNVTTVDASLSLVSFLSVEKRPIELSVEYTPEEPTLDDTVILIGQCFDVALGEFAENLTVDFYAHNLAGGDDVLLGTSFTNSSGVATLLWSPRSCSEQYDLSPNFVLRVVCLEGDYTEMAEVDPVHIDTRYPTRLEFLGSEVMNVHVGWPYDLRWKLTSENGSFLAERTINVYYMNKTSPILIWTEDDGIATWRDWTPPYVGTFWFKAIFQEGSWNWYYRDSNEVKVAAIADVVPVSILFDVQPRELKSGDYVTLIATVFNTSSGLPLPNTPVSFYVVNAMGQPGPIGNRMTNGSGVARLTCLYGVGPWAFMANVGVNQTIMSSSTMLTVAEETVLPLTVNQQSGFKHIISGRLLSYDEPVIGKKVKIYVNGTLETELTTWEVYGNFSLALDLPAVENKPTIYNIQAVFEGDAPSNATAYAYTPNGTEYAVCTTIQYGFKPAVNSTMLTVEPQSTQVMQQTKTPEQMQQEAEQSGWLSTWHEFSWWYPWYRLHVKININPMIDIGFNPILPGGETWLWDGLEFFEGLTEEVISDILLDVSGLFSAYLIARKLSIVNPALGLALEIAKLAFQSILLYTSDWQTRGTRLLGSSIGSIMMGLLAINMNIAKTFVDTLIRLCKWVSSAMMNLFTILMNILSVEQLISRWWMDAIEISGDFLLGGLGIVRYLGGI